MLKRSDSKRSAGLRYLLLLPVLTVMLFYASCAQETEVNPPGEDSSNEFTQSDGSDIMENIAALKEAIAAKGEMTDKEQQALKALYVITSEEGVNNVHFSDVKDDIQLPFGAIQKVPVFPGCEGLENVEAQKCFTRKVTEFIVQNFNTKVDGNSGIEGRQRIAVQFTVSDQGLVRDVRAKAQYPELMEEALRVVNMLPRMQPGEHEGKKVNVSFALPIIFEL